jgi:hypothetical protein
MITLGLVVGMGILGFAWVKVRRQRKTAAAALAAR